MSVHKRKDRGNWWSYRRVVKLPDGRKERISGKAPINTKASAEAAERAHIERVLRGDVDKPPAPLFADFADRFLEDYAKVHNKPGEALEKERVIKRYLKPAFKRRRLDQVAVADIERLKARLLKSGRPRGEGAEGRSPKTVNNILNVLSRIFSYAVDLEVIDRGPRIRKLKAAQVAIDFLDFEEYEALLSAAVSEPTWHLAIMLGGDAGLRRGELRALRWKDWERRSKRLIVQRSESRGHVGTTKGWRDRSIPTTKRLDAALRKARHLRGELVLCDGAGEPFEEKVWRGVLSRICLRAGLREIGWHCLRHTFCAHLAMRGAPAKAIQELAGHADLATTMRYMHLTPDARDAAIALLDGRDTNVPPRIGEAT